MEAKRAKPDAAPGEAIAVEYAETESDGDHVDASTVLEVEIEELHDVINCPECSNSSPKSSIDENSPCNHTSPGEGFPNSNPEGASIEAVSSEGNHTSPGTTDEDSQESLGSQIARFIREQRVFSDDLSQSSPASIVSQDSSEEIKQVFVDGTNGLIIGENMLEVVCDVDPTRRAQSPHEGGVSEAVGLEYAASSATDASEERIAIPREKKQACITDFFQRSSFSISSSQTIPGFVYGRSAAMEKLLPTNGTAPTSDPKL